MSFRGSGPLIFMKKTYTGSCHCGAVAYRVDLDLAAGTSRCNCTFCSKSRIWIAIAKADAFELVRGADALTDYQHTPRGKPAPFLHLTFCKTCGVRPFAKGGHLPALGSEFYAISVATLDGLTDEERASIPIQYVDGRNDDWQHAPSEHRHL
ncbi:MAG: Gfa-like protein [Myxococcales bacterium]|nr:Gfa-like protein [Myxococcales bacterium]